MGHQHAGLMPRFLTESKIAARWGRWGGPDFWWTRWDIHELDEPPFSGLGSPGDTANDLSLVMEDMDE